MTSDQTDDFTARFPGPVRFHPSRLKFVLLLIVCLLFSFGGIYMVRDGASGGWAVLLFFGLGVLVCIAIVLPGANGLTLGPDGFEVRSMYRGARTRWQDASGFMSAQIPPYGHNMVVYDDATIKPGMLAKANVGMTGRNAALPDTYGMNADGLAALMEAWRARALRRI